jgi:hypothetical protein
VHGAVPVRRVALAAARPGRRPEQLRALRGGCDAARGAPTRLLLAGRPHNMASMVASAPMSSMRGMSNPGSVCVVCVCVCVCGKIFRPVALIDVEYSS